MTVRRQEPATQGVYRHMAGVERYRENLKQLQATWDNLTLLGQLSGAGINMSTTRQAFHDLTDRLLSHLGQETLKKRIQEIKSRAQVAIDIMVRNLFERTADIGFLATDFDVRATLEQTTLLRNRMAQTFGSDREQSQNNIDDLTRRLRQRFAEYVQKYSVYANIILLDPVGNVLCQLDETSGLQRSTDPLVEEALNTHANYVEVFRQTDLVPGCEPALIYAYRVTDTTGEVPIGVLCLQFRFTNETAGIFANLRHPGDWAVLTLLEPSGKVIASSDHYHIPVGAQLELSAVDGYSISRFGGREYLSVTRASQGYQGYMGPGWLGHVMIPITHAFDHDSTGELEAIDDHILSRVLNDANLFGTELRAIPQQAAMIQEELNRAVWNGNVQQCVDGLATNPAFAKVLLWEISNTGQRTTELFESSIANLLETVVSAILDDSRFMASLAIDIMDRNLYERANDCRWWALTSHFRAALTHGGSHQISEILQYINGLYTVYDNLLVFDRQRRVVAVSNPAYSHLVGTVVSEQWAYQTLDLNNSQGYVVSPFVSTTLYAERPTYIYAAAIRDPANTDVVGGIGIVFDSEPQFAAMLRDALPRNETGELMEGALGLFVDRQGRVIASTDDCLPPGSCLEFSTPLLDLANGTGGVDILDWRDQYYVAGATVSRGYREFKGSVDPYRNDVVALVMVPLCRAKREAIPAVSPRLRLSNQRQTAHGDVVEIATFTIGNNLFGIHTANVVEAIAAEALVEVPGGPQYLSGYLMYRGDPLAIIELRSILKSCCEERVPEKRQIIVIRYQEGVFGVLVDQLGEIPAIPRSNLQQINTMITGDNVLTDLIAKLEETDGERVVLILNPDRIAQRLRQQHREEQRRNPVRVPAVQAHAG